LLQDDLAKLLRDLREKDRYAQRTQAGIHRDDLDFRLDDQKFKSVASQGQRKSLLFACKLAEFELLKKQNKFAPLLLLDDVFEKLDEKRMENLLFKVCRENSGQVFLTDTHPERVKTYFSGLDTTLQLILLESVNDAKGN
jgi:DNA replication and repair protein RecF